MFNPATSTADITIRDPIQEKIWHTFSVKQNSWFGEHVLVQHNCVHTFCISSHKKRKIIILHKNFSSTMTFIIIIHCWSKLWWHGILSPKWLSSSGDLQANHHQRRKLPASQHLEKTKLLPLFSPPFYSNVMDSYPLTSRCQIFTHNTTIHKLTGCDGCLTIRILIITTVLAFLFFKTHICTILQSINKIANVITVLLNNHLIIYQSHKTLKMYLNTKKPSYKDVDTPNV